jgi:hypothetical protein
MTGVYHLLQTIIFEIFFDLAVEKTEGIIIDSIDFVLKTQCYLLSN